MRWASWVAVGLSLSGCFLRHGRDEDPCQVPPAGQCRGAINGVDVSGPLDPVSGWIPLDAQAAPSCGEDPHVLLLSCRGQQLKVRAVYPDAEGDTPACGWSTDAPQPAPAMVSAPLHQEAETEWRTHGTVDATFADGSRVTITYDLVDDAVCVPVAEPEKHNALIAGLAFAASVPLRVLATPGHTPHAGHHHHHHHHHH
ncbi:MAG: hypothetical protein QM723_31310 [Myxococcaceae bacterium]